MVKKDILYKHMNYINKKGFTLIELLIVIAIIGILASVVVVSLTGQSGNATDATNKFELRQIATQAALLEAGGVDDPDSNDVTVFLSLEDLCTSAKVESIRKGVAKDPTKFTTEVPCFASSTGWAASFTLNDPTSTWCIDSSGFVGGEKTAKDASGSTVPVCN